MATIDSELINLDANIANANIVKEIVLTRLYDDGHIPEKTYNTFMENWQMIIIKRGWFQRWLKKFGPKDDPETYQYMLVQFEEVEPETMSESLETK